MKILYRQKKDSVLDAYGFTDCCLKAISISEERHPSVAKMHHHNEYEIHVITEGYQIYETELRQYRVESGCFLIIPPGIKHKMTGELGNTKKLAFTFRTDPSRVCFALLNDAECFLGALPPAFFQSFDFIHEQSHLPSVIARRLLEHTYYNTVILLFRTMGISEDHTDMSAERSTPMILSMAKQYIADNIESAPTAGDIVLYCHISERQLARIFKQHEGISLFEYIRQCRIEHIKELLADPAISLKEISDRMHFGSEYYFNEFCKKNCGMPPGAYRKMKISNSPSVTKEAKEP